MFIDNRPNRAPEDGHTARCLAASMIAAIENVRDALTDDYRRISHRDADDIGLGGEFRNMLQSGHIFAEAERYLDDGTMTCICPATIPHIEALLDTNPWDEA